MVSGHDTTEQNVSKEDKNHETWGHLIFFWRNEDISHLLEQLEVSGGPQLATEVLLGS